MDRSDFEVILSTCNKIEMPPNPSKKEARVMLVEIAFCEIEAISFNPLVSSTSPVSKGLVNSWQIPKKCQNRA